LELIVEKDGGGGGGGGFILCYETNRLKMNITLGEA